MACLYVLISSSKCFTVGWKCSNLSFGLKAAILKLSQKLKGLLRRLHVLLNKNTRSVKMENLVNLRCVKQKYSFSQRVFENWSYFTVSIIIQASYKHQLLKITVRISHFGVAYGTVASFKFKLIDKLTPAYKRSCWDWLFDQVWCSKIEQESSYDSWNMVKYPYKHL